MLPTRDGTYNAYPISVTLNQTGRGSLTTAIIKYAIFEESRNGAWVDCADQNLEITGYHYLEKLNGDSNDHTIESLKSALGWPGDDLAWLAETDVSQRAVQIVCKSEMYGSKSRMKVAFLNAYGTAPRESSKADDDTMAEMCARYRRKRGLTPFQSVAPPPQKPLPPPPPPQKKAGCTHEEAWAAFAAGNVGKSEADLQKLWYIVLDSVLQGKTDGDITPDDWMRVRDEWGQHIPPF